MQGVRRPAYLFYLTRTEMSARTSGRHATEARARPGWAVLPPLREAICGVPASFGASGVDGAERWLAEEGAPRHRTSIHIESDAWGPEGTAARFGGWAVTEDFKKSIRSLMDRWALAVATYGWAGLSAPVLLVLWMALLVRTVALTTLETYVKTVSSFLWRAARVWPATQ